MAILTHLADEEMKVTFKISHLHLTLRRGVGCFSEDVLLCLDPGTQRVEDRSLWSSGTEECRSQKAVLWV